MYKKYIKKSILKQRIKGTNENRQINDISFLDFLNPFL